MDSSISAYLETVSTDRKEAFCQLRDTLLKTIDPNCVEVISYGMIGYVIPHSIYPAGYHCDPKLPLPFISIANQKSHIALYHMGVYADPSLLDWFVNTYTKEVGKKPDMGKSCIRFKKPEQIPFELIGQLISKMSVASWIELYEKNLKR